MAEQISKIAAELRATEALYLQDLTTMVTIYVKPALKFEVLSKEDRQQIFSNLEELMGCNKALLEALSQDGEDGPLLSTLASAFITVAPFLKLYTTCAQKPRLRRGGTQTREAREVRTRV